MNKAKKVLRKNTKRKSKQTFAQKQIAQFNKQHSGNIIIAIALIAGFAFYLIIEKLSVAFLFVINLALWNTALGLAIIAASLLLIALVLGLLGYIYLDNFRIRMRNKAYMPDENGMYPKFVDASKGKIFDLNLTTKAITELHDEDNDSEEFRMQLFETINKRLAIKQWAVSDKNVNVSTARMLSNAYSKRKPLAEKQEYKIVEEEVKQFAVPKLTVNEAINQSQTKKWVVGQNEQSYCEIDFIYSFVSSAIVGAQGSGKTTLAKLLIKYAQNFDMHVIVLNGGDNDEWSRYNSLEAYRFNAGLAPEELLKYLDEIDKLYERRNQELNNLGKDDIEGTSLQHILIVIEEFGAAMEEIKTDKALYTSTIKNIKKMLRLGRKRGIHMLFLDQTTEQLSKFKSLIPNIFILKGGGYAGFDLRVYGASELKKHQFILSGQSSTKEQEQVYNTFDASSITLSSTQADKILFIHSFIQPKAVSTTEIPTIKMNEQNESSSKRKQSLEKEAELFKSNSKDKPVPYKKRAGYEDIEKTAKYFSELGLNSTTICFLIHGYATGKYKKQIDDLI